LVTQSWKPPTPANADVLIARGAVWADQVRPLSLVIAEVCARSSAVTARTVPRLAIVMAS
jgi:hypothetical protein